MIANLSAESLAYLSLVGWAGYADPAWRAYRHLRLLASALEDVAHGRCQRLLVTMPPQHGKSLLTSRAFPSWVIGRWPNRRVILASYEATYAALWGRRSRDVLTEHGQRVFGIRLKRDSNAADHWEVAGANGIMHTAGAGGAITGHSADIAIIDDPTKNMEEACSATLRPKLIEWYHSVLLTRLSAQGSVVLVQTRWHEGDLAGHLLSTERARWRVVNLPALAEEGDPLGRAPGEVLCEQLHPLSQILEFKRQSSYVFSALYQQRPVPAGGGLFKREWARRYQTYRQHGQTWYRVVDTGEVFAKSALTRFVTVDTATSEKTKSDFTSIACWGVHPTNRRLVLLDLDLRRIEAPEIVRSVKAMLKKHDAIVPWVEETTGSKHLLSFLKAEGFLFKTLKPDGSKFTRAVPASAIMEQGRFLYPADSEDLPWLVEFERQLYSFPSGMHDDAVDTLAYAAQVLTEQGVGGSEPPDVSDWGRGGANPLDGLAPPSPFK